MATDDPDPVSLASRLARIADTATPRALTQLAGGKNNRVFRIETDGLPLILKSYHHDPRDSRDRLGAEWSFLSYAWERGVRTIPRPLACDAAAHAALYSFVSGRKLPAGEIDGAAVDAAATFVAAVNVAPRNVHALAAASEACFSLDDHLATIRRRVVRLEHLDPQAPHRNEAEAFVHGQLAPAWARVETAVRASADKAGLGVAAAIDATEMIVSPSDFGFHNALASDDGRITFIDFEYAGRDDPAKLACDFFCAPEIPVPLRLRASFQQALAERIGLADSFIRRADILLDAYRIKWICIMLNDFLPVAAARRAFSVLGERSERCRAQLRRAEDKLAELGRF